MQRIVFLLIPISIIFSCSPEPSQQELLIADYVQTIGDTKTDLSFELISFQWSDTLYQREITSEVRANVADSRSNNWELIELEVKGIDRYYDYAINKNEDFIKSTNEYIAGYRRMGVTDQVDQLKQNVIDAKKQIQELDSSRTSHIELLNKSAGDSVQAAYLVRKLENLSYSISNPESTRREEILYDWVKNINSLDSLESLKQDSILSMTAKVLYKIKNPILNNAEQQISKTFIFNSSGNEILGAE